MFHIISKGKGKTAVVVEKKPARRWGEKKFQPRDSNLNRPKPTTSTAPKSPPINRNFDIRKMAEERATKRFKSEKGSLQAKKGNLSKSTVFGQRRENKLTLSKALDDKVMDDKERSLASVRRARLKEKKNLNLETEKNDTKKNSKRNKYP